MSEPTGFTTDFFGNQERARKNTGRLIFYFILAVVLIILSVYVAVSLAWLALSGQTESKDLAQTVGAWRLADPMLFAVIASGTIGLIALGSLYKIAALGKGGAAVALMLGGRRINPASTNPDERKVLNVVEEMAIASGVPVPDVYLLDNESGINAFAAGFSPASCVIGVTRGTATRLSRDELQGVIAHEFSHILNGDMRLNIRLIGLLHGILLIGITGRVIMEAILRGGLRGRRSSSSKKDGGGGAAILVILALGGALMAIGYIGVFFGKLIKAAVSRQREFLADASAVQFTRNPEGIGGALMKIGGLSKGAKISNAHAMEASHMFFGNALKSAFSGGWLATHPPIPERIRAIFPSWDGKIPEFKQSDNEAVREAAEYERKIEEHRQRTKAGAGSPPPLPLPFPLPIPGTQGGAGLPGMPAGGGIPGMPGGAMGLAGAEALAQAAGGIGAQPGGFRYNVPPERLMREIGQLNPNTIEHATTMLSAIPDSMREAARHPMGARAVVAAILLSPDAAVREQQLRHVGEQLGAEALDYLRQMREAVESLGPAARLPLLELAMPALRALGPEDVKKFLENVEGLAEADQRVSLFEFALLKILRHHLEPVMSGKVDRAIVRYYSMNAVVEDVAVALSAMAYAGSGDEAARRHAFAAGMARLGETARPLDMLPVEQCTVQRLDEALDRLRQSIPGVKRRVMEVLAWATAADGKVTIEEAELLRAMGDTLDCPIPPLVGRGAGQA